MVKNTIAAKHWPPPPPHFFKIPIGYVVQNIIVAKYWPPPSLLSLSERRFKICPLSKFLLLMDRRFKILWPQNVTSLPLIFFLLIGERVQNVKVAIPVWYGDEKKLWAQNVYPLPIFFYILIPSPITMYECLTCCLL